jgi:hypothetical protein
MDVEEIIINLTIISQIERGNRLMTRGSFLNIEPRSIIPESIRRWNRQDNRNETLKRLNNVVNHAILILPTNGFHVKSYLENSKQGIINLKETYSTCNQTCARLDILLDKIKLAIGEQEPHEIETDI